MDVYEAFCSVFFDVLPTVISAALPNSFQTTKTAPSVLLKKYAEASKYQLKGG